MYKSITKSMCEIPSLATTVLIPLLRHLNRESFAACKVRDLVKLMERSRFIMPNWMVKSSEEFVSSLCLNFFVLTCQFKQEYVLFVFLL